MQPQASARIDEIYEHVVRARFLTGIAARQFATEVYLDEQRGYFIPANHALRLAERAAGMGALRQALVAA